MLAKAGVEFGAGQKLVNMTFKYFVAVKTIYDFKPIEIDEENGDCPLDSNIINWVNKDNCNYSACTKLKKMNMKNFQDDIAGIREVNAKSNLE